MELWKVRSTSLLSLISGPLCPGVVGTVRVSSIGLIKNYSHLTGILDINNSQLYGIKNSYVK